MKRRYIVASLAFLGFCVIYMLRVNLSVAIVAMTANRTHESNGDNHQIAIVRLFFYFESRISLSNLTVNDNLNYFSVRG